MLRNFLDQLKRYLAKPMKGEKVRLSYRQFSEIVETNDKGIFRKQIELNDVIDMSFAIKWETFLAEALLSDTEETIENSVSAQSQVMLIGEKAKLAVISDIDDTVLLSHSTKIPAKLRLMLFKNSYTRKPFPGVSELYRKIAGKRKMVPFFYVSSSEWNLYSPLVDFFQLNELPDGVFLLQDLNYSIFKFWKSGGGNHQHKKEKIRELMLFYPKLDIILFGDNGQSDPLIYKAIADEFPERVKAVILRRIKNHKSETFVHDSIPYYYVKNSKEGAEKLQDLNLI